MQKSESDLEIGGVENGCAGRVVNVAGRNQVSKISKRYGCMIHRSIAIVSRAHRPHNLHDILHRDPRDDVVLLDVALGESLHPAVHALPRLLWLPFEVHRLDLKRNAKLGFLIEIATQHLIDFGELKERPIMLSPGRRELAADTRSASTLSQSKACSRAGEKQF